MRHQYDYCNRFRLHDFKTSSEIADYTRASDFSNYFGFLNAGKETNNGIGKLFKNEGYCLYKIGGKSKAILACFCVWSRDGVKINYVNAKYFNTPCTTCTM